MNLLWVEDERRIVDEVAPFLEEEGCRVTRAESAEDALRLLARHTYDLLLLDWMLPDMPGTELCKEVQRRWRTPVIMLTAKSDEWHKVVALEIGADDYLSKPFGMRELLARIKAVLRRSGALSSAEQQALQRGRLTIDIAKHQVWSGEQEVTLTPTEFDLLLTLARHPGRVYSRLQLITDTLGDSFGGFERTVDSHIRNLRHKLEDDPASPRYIVTVYGVGYKFGGEL